MADLPPLATVEDLAEWVGEEVPNDDAQALAYLAAASAVVRSYTGRRWVDDAGQADAPAEVRTVVVQVAARVWRNPDGYIQDTTGPFTVRWSERIAEGIYLTAGEEDMLAPHRRGRPAVFTLSTTRGPVETGTVATPGSLRPIVMRRRP